MNINYLNVCLCDSSVVVRDAKAISRGCDNIRNARIKGSDIKFNQTYILSQYKIINKKEKQKQRETENSKKCVA